MFNSKKTLLIIIILLLTHFSKNKELNWDYFQGGKDWV